MLDANSPSEGDLKGEDPVLELTLPTDFSEDVHRRFASLLPEPEVDNPEKHPSFCLTADHVSREVVFTCHRITFRRPLSARDQRAGQRLSACFPLPPDWNIAGIILFFLTFPNTRFPYIHSNRGAHSPDDSH